MKKITYLISSALALPTVMADFGPGGCSMMDFSGSYGMMGGVGFGFLWLVWLALGAFVVSAVFWLTYKWLMGGNKKRRK